MNIGSLYLSFLIGTIGLGYVMYGKKISNIIMILSGMGMMIYPYFVKELWLSIIVGFLLFFLPFIFNKY